MLLELLEIRKSFGKGENRVEVLRGISLGVEKGQFCVLLGPSGSGKSTLLNIIGGIDSADSGEILISRKKGGGASAVEPERLGVMSEKELTRYRREHLGYDIPDSIFIEMFLIGTATYIAVALFELRKIRAIPMTDAFKDVM